MLQLKDKRFIYYLLLIAVVVVWGADPVVTEQLYVNYSASALSALWTFASFILFFIISIKKLKKINKSFLKIAVQISLLNSLACLLQKIGLQYTTPAYYSFLEYLCCLSVPLTMLLLFKKRPNKLKWLGAILCFIGCFTLCAGGILTGGVRFGVGEMLCALAGVIFGVAIAATGVKAKGLDVTLFMTVHMAIYFLFSLGTAIILNVVRIGGNIAEPLRFSLSPQHLLPALAFGILTVGVCWLFKTAATQRLDPTSVAVISPFAALVTAVISVSVSMDEASFTLPIASALIVLASITSGLSDSKK